jgi:hypothetical protein
MCATSKTRCAPTGRLSDKGEGADFDPDAARTFVELMRRMEGRIEHASLADLRAGVQATAPATSP